MERQPLETKRFYNALVKAGIIPEDACIEQLNIVLNEDYVRIVMVQRADQRLLRLDLEGELGEEAGDDG